MAYRDDERWGESRLDRQDSVAADGWSKRSDFEESGRDRQPRVHRTSRRSPWAGLLLVGIGLVVAAAAFHWLVG